MSTYVITGASRGLGLQFVEDLLARGEVVVALARNPEGSAGLQKIKSDKLFKIKVDIADASSIKTAAAEVAKVVSSVDVLIHNAAVQDPPYVHNTLIDFPSEGELISDFQLSFTTNVIGPMLTTNAFLPLLRKGTQKKIVFLNTGLADPALTLSSGYSKHTSYCVTKAALRMVSMKYHNTLKDEGFTCLDLSPGVVNTATTPPTDEEMKEIMGMMGLFQKIYPKWTGPINAPESVGLMLGLMDKATVSDSGSFLSHKGNQEWL